MQTTSCFIHVPKTGGSWITDALRAALPADAMYVAPSADAAQIPVAPLLERYAMVAGHFTMAQLRDVMGRAFLFTFLRSPVDRVLSLYYFYREQAPAERLDPRVALAKSLDIEQFVAQLPDRISPWSNWQTYVFSGATHVERPAAELLPMTLANLERLDFVGVQDALAEAVLELAEIRRWAVVPPAGRVNATRQRATLDQLPLATIDRLRALNRCDTALYLAARERWRLRRGHGRATTRQPAAGPTTPQRREMGTRDVLITATEVSASERRIVVRAESAIAVSNLTIGVRVTDQDGAPVFGTNTYLQGRPLNAAPGERLEVVFEIDPAPAPGTYFVTVAAHRGADHLEGCFHWIDNAVAFTQPD